MIGTILSNRYKLIAELGSGGMAWVYLGEDLREKKRVAVKVLYPQHSQDLNFLQRFMQEAKLAMSLSQCAPQQQIVCVLDYGSDQDTHYLVMEFVEGRDLRQVLEERGALPWPEALDIARQVAMALDHAHKHEVVHRDVKPGNIMILSDGTARVLDFGIARARTSPHLTLSGFVGSPHYSSPEQAMGHPVDIRADIYSLGIVLYRMLSGQLPFQADTPWAIVNQHVTSPPPPLEDIQADLPTPVVHLVEKALAKQPKDRFQTPMEMLEAIETALAGHELPPISHASAAPVPLDETYRRAQVAFEAEAWQEAVTFFSQIVKVEPDYRDVNEKLAVAGRQVRLEALYTSVKRALQTGRWNQALTQLDEISRIAPGYRDVDELRDMAENQQELEIGERTMVTQPAEQPMTAKNERIPSVSATVDVDSPKQSRTQSRTQPRARSRGSRRHLWWVAALALLLALVVGGGYLFLNYAQQPPTPTSAIAIQPSPTQTHTPTSTLLPTITSTTAPQSTHTATALPSTSTPSPTPSTPVTSTPTTTPTSAIISGPSPAASTARPALSGKIVFPRFSSSRGTYDVYACRVDGANCRRVATEASQPHLLPNGNQVVLHSWKADDKGLILQTLSGQRIWRITELIEAARPSVDFQGKIYVYQAREEADRQPRLYRTYDAETRPLRHSAVTVVGSSPSWLPDGRILYNGCIRDTCGIIVMNSDGSFPRQVVAGGTETNPEASPDGERVAFMSQRDGNWEVYVVGIDGQGLTRLTRNPANDGLPVWSPDGQHIAFVSDRDGEWAVWVMQPNGKAQRRLFSLGGSLDGRVQNAAPHETHGWVEERISWGVLP
jgi:tRNA A-37 threonylcarbamoyl transferase component Bud32